MDAFDASNEAKKRALWLVQRREKQGPPSGDWDIWMVVSGRGFGKLVDMETPVPTPSGWARLGDIQVGDQVFDESGKVCTVLETHDDTPDKAYRFTFSDGTYIDCCSEHQWVTWTHRDRKEYSRSARVVDKTKFSADWPAWRHNGRQKDIIGPSVRTAQEVVDTFTYGKRGDTNHCIPTCLPLDLPDADLPVDPYVLGAWLGDGLSACAAITIGEQDSHELLGHLAEHGAMVSGPPRFSTYGGNSGTYPIGGTRGLAGGGLSLQTRLREIGVLKNKHVPASYLRASSKQRLLLLQGLMDSDGWASSAQVEFCSTNRLLADGVVELARSLGQKPRFSEERATLYGKDCGPKYRVFWKPTINVFKLSRKANKVSTGGAQSLRNHHRMIVSYEEIAPVPMRCLTVDSPHSMFLIGEGMIPTHNTRLAAEWLWWRAYRAPGTRWAIVAPTFSDGRDTCIEGDSGLLRCAPDGFVKTYNRSMGEIIFANGSRGKIFSAEEPERLRGPQHHGAWMDEFAAMDNQEAVWDQLNFGLRLGKHPQVVITTTPKPTKLMKELMGRGDSTVAVTVGTTFENAANLAPSTLEALRKRYEGTRLGRQELYGELLGDVEGALWNRGLIPEPESPPKAMLRLVVAVDPPGGGRAEAGLVVAGVDWDQRFWVLADHSGRMSPNEWAGKAIDLYREHRADCVVAERNFGGAMVESTIQQAIEMVRVSHPYFEVPVKLVTASRGKQQRAEPIVALYEQGRVHHVKGLGELEEQMIEWIPGEGDSPDRVDACFVAGTMIATPSGEVPIESVRPGDLVHTRSGPRRVLKAAMTSADAALWRLETATGLSLVGTANHPIAAADGSWTAMNMLDFHGGAVVRLEGVDSVMSSRALSMTAPVYNLEVEDVHEYVANGIVVHNCVWALHELSESPVLMPVAPGGASQRSFWR